MRAGGQGSLRAVMEEGDVRESYEWLERLARNPYADDDSAVAVPGAPQLALPFFLQLHLLAYSLFALPFLVRFPSLQVACYEPIILQDCPRFAAAGVKRHPHTIKEGKRLCNCTDDLLPVGGAARAGMLPPVQKAVFSLLPSLAPAELPQLWPDLLQLLLNLLRPRQLLLSQSQAAAASSPAHDAPQQQQQQQQLSAASKASNVNRHALSALSMETAVDILSQLYRWATCRRAASSLSSFLLSGCCPSTCMNLGSFNCWWMRAFPGLHHSGGAYSDCC
jgi:hypothetical protein